MGKSREDCMPTDQEMIDMGYHPPSNATIKGDTNPDRLFNEHKLNVRAKMEWQKLKELEANRRFAKDESTKAYLDHVTTMSFLKHGC